MVMRFTDIDEGYLARAISDESGMEHDVARAFAGLTIELGTLSESIVWDDSVPQADVYGVLTRDRRLSVDLSDIAVTALKAIIGVTPLAALVTVLETIPAMSGSVRILTPTQQKIAGLMEAWSGRMVQITELRVFASRTMNESEEDINDALDDMADKGLIEIRTRVMWATW